MKEKRTREMKEGVWQNLEATDFLHMGNMEVSW
jgi:hypothetical protein